MLKIDGKPADTFTFPLDVLIKKLEELPDDELFTTARLSERFSMTGHNLKTRAAKLQKYCINVNGFKLYWGNPKTIKNYKDGKYFKG